MATRDSAGNTWRGQYTHAGGGVVARRGICHTRSPAAFGRGVWDSLEAWGTQSGPGILARLLLWAFGQVVKFVESQTAGGVGSSDLLTALPPYASYANPLVRQAWGVVQGAASRLEAAVGSDRWEAAV